jgi:hypothetical protein
MSAAAHCFSAFYLKSPLFFPLLVSDLKLLVSLVRELIVSLMPWEIEFLFASITVS